MQMITIKNLCKKYDEKMVLSDINIEIEKGEIYGLIGRSGVGKSTLLRCINGLEGFDGGELCVDGTDITKLKDKEMREFRKGIGMIFQQFSLLKRLTVFENIALPMKMWKYPKEQIAARVTELLELVGLEEKADAYPEELSGGQKQRVAIARALTMEPQILLCDEATSALDPQTAKSIIQLLVNINKELGITIIVVTHQMSVVKSCCERIALMEDGRIAVSGGVEEVFMEQSEPLARLMGQKELALPKHGTTLKIVLSGRNSEEPVISMIARELGIDIRILGGEMELFRGKMIGTIVLNVDEKDCGKVLDFLEKKEIKWFRIPDTDGKKADGTESVRKGTEEEREGVLC